VPERCSLSRRQGSSCDHLDCVGKVKKILRRIIRATVRCTGQAHVTKSPDGSIQRGAFDAILEVAELRHSSRLDYSRLESARIGGIETVEDAGRVQRAKTEGNQLAWMAAGRISASSRAETKIVNRRPQFRRRRTP